MTKMVIWGVDNSINGTGLCVMNILDDGSLVDIKLHGFSKTMKYIDGREVVFKDGNVEVTHLGSGYSKIPYHNRPKMIAETLLSRYEKPDYVFFEDYALSSGSKSNNLTYVAEFCGGLKECFYEICVPYYVYTPSQIKLFATDNGGADKTVMGSSFIKSGLRNKYVKSDKFNLLDEDESPKADMVDAFWIAALGRFHVLLKLNEHRGALLQSLTIKKSSMFTKKSKKQKLALIDEPFVRKGKDA